MDGLTAKVFRTYNASITLQNQLEELTDRKWKFIPSIFFATSFLTLFGLQLIQLPCGRASIIQAAFDTGM